MYNSLYLNEIKQAMKCAMQTLVFSTCQLEIRENCWCYCVMLEWLPMHCVYLNTHTGVQRGDPSDECYKCHRPGHMARDCPGDRSYARAPPPRGR